MWMNETQLKKAPDEDVLFYVNYGRGIFKVNQRRMDKFLCEILNVPAEINFVYFYVTSHKC
jgi:hypothetical protein